VTSYSIRNRRRKARLISDWLAGQGAETVLMVGAMSTTGLANQGIVEAAVARNHRVIAGINVQLPGAGLGYPFALADARAMPFPDDCVDVALANAVIEHVGDEADQRRFIAEHSRVARCWIITTPNKWFPIESHTAVVFLHWFPAWRAKRDEFTRLLSRRELKAMLPRDAIVHGRPWSTTFTALYNGRT
jgi:hypothetical protein